MSDHVICELRLIINFFSDVLSVFVSSVVSSANHKVFLF